MTIDKAELAVIRQQGVERGADIASWIDVPEALDSCADYCGACDTERARTQCWMENEAHESESNSRQYSPFEDTATEFNGMDEFDSEDAWTTFDEGINAGISDIITKRLTIFPPGHAYLHQRHQRRQLGY